MHCFQSEIYYTYYSSYTSFRFVYILKFEFDWYQSSIKVNRNAAINNIRRSKPKGQPNRVRTLYSFFWRYHCYCEFQCLQMMIIIYVLIHSYFDSIMTGDPFVMTTFSAVVVVAGRIKASHCTSTWLLFLFLIQKTQLRSDSISLNLSRAFRIRGKFCLNFNLYFSFILGIILVLVKTKKMFRMLLWYTNNLLWLHKMEDIERTIWDFDCCSILFDASGVQSILDFCFPCSFYQVHR